MDTIIKKVRILPQSGTQSVTIGTSSSSSTFELPANSVYRLDQSELEYVLTPTAGGANKYNAMHAKRIPSIQRIEFYDSQSRRLVNLEDANYYTDVTSSTMLSIDSIINEGYAIAGSNAAITSIPLSSYVRINNSTLETANNNALTPSLVWDSVKVTGANYLAVGTADTADPVLYVRFKLGEFLGTLFACNKHLYFGQTMYLKITWAPRDYHGMVATGAYPITGGQAVLAGNIAMTGLVFHLASESNEQLNQQVINSVREVVYEDTTMFKQAGLTGTSQNVILNLDRSVGLTLKRIFHTVWNSTESAATTYDRNSTNDAKVKEYYTMANTTREQADNIDTSAFGDWALIKRKMKGSFSQDVDHFLYNWFHLSDYSGVSEDKPLHVQAKEDYGEIQGIPLDLQFKWQFVGVSLTSATYNHRSFVTTNRILRFSGNQFTIDNGM